MNDEIKELKSKYRLGNDKNLTQSDMLKLLLSYTEKHSDVSEISEKLLDNYGSISSVSQEGLSSVIKNYGISMQSAVIFDIIRNLDVFCNKNKSDNVYLSDTEKAGSYFYERLRWYSQERVIVTAVYSNMRVKKHQIISCGNEISVFVDTDKVLEFAVRNKAEYIFISHNHPKSSAEPSESDIVTTKGIISSLNSIGIVLADHIICGENSTFSMRKSCDELKFQECVNYITE